MSAASRGWALPIRRWLALALVVVVCVPVVVTGGIAYHLLGVSTSVKSEAITQIRNDVAEWNNPEWQAATRDKFAPHGVDFVLVEDGHTIFSSSADPLSDAGGHGSRTVQEFTVPQTTPQRTFSIYTDQFSGAHTNMWLIPLIALATLLMTLAAIAWFLGQTVLRPLAATGDAARQIADGNLEFDIPTSRVREVAEVNRAFAAMSDALRASLNKQAQVEQERRLFIGAIVHDLRTPVFTLRGYLEGLHAGLADTPEKRTRYIEITQEKASALERLISDLFEFTRLEYLDQDPHREMLDFGALLERLVDGLRPQASAKDIDLTISPLPEHFFVSGDSHLLSRAAENILVNALRHTPSGGQILVECQNEPNRVLVSFSDTGPGIPDSDLPHIFKPLYRGEQSRSRRTGGAGLGLTTAKSIIVAHEGNVTAMNRVGGGAEICVSLPRPSL